MIYIKTKSDLEKMRRAGIITGNALAYAGQIIKVGMSTFELDKHIHDYIVKNGAKPSFLGLYGFPGSACISINDEVIHGIPSRKRFIQDGDVVSVDVGAYIDGFHGDSAFTYPVGNVSEENMKLLRTTQQSLFKGIEQAVVGNRIGDIGYAVSEHCNAHDYGVVKEYIGHGVGKDIHESPEVPNYGKQGRGVRLVAGMVIAIEPMINGVGAEVKQLSDGWTIKTKSGSYSAHYEHTVAITSDGPVLLTEPTIIKPTII